MFKVVFKRKAEKELSHLPMAIIVRIYAVVERLSIDPFLLKAKKLFGFKDLYRIRVGDYRVVYLVDTAVKVISITRIAHRKDVYRK